MLALLKAWPSTRQAGLAAGGERGWQVEVNVTVMVGVVVKVGVAVAVGVTVDVGLKVGVALLVALELGVLAGRGRGAGGGRGGAGGGGMLRRLTVAVGVGLVAVGVIEAVEKLGLRVAVTVAVGLVVDSRGLSECWG